MKLASSSFADLIGHAYDTAADPRCRRHSQAVTTAGQPLRADLSAPAARRPPQGKSRKPAPGLSQRWEAPHHLP